MIRFDDLVPRLAIFAGRVPDPYLEAAIADSLRSLCRDTLCWAFTHSAIPVAAGENPIDLYELPADSTVIQVVWAHFDAQRLRLGSTDQWVRQSATWLTDLGTPGFIQTGETPNTVRLYPTPQSIGELVVGLALQPSFSATSIDETLWNRYSEAVIDGACYRVFQLPGKAWSDPQSALFYLSRYEVAKRVITSQAVDGFQKSMPRQVRYGGY